MTDRIAHIGPHKRVVGDPTPGMVREQAIAAGDLWSGYVTTEAGMLSGWHHHGDHDTSVYVVDGALRMEFGPGGADSVEARAGDFLHIPKNAVHREGNPGDVASHVIVTRNGSGPVTVNVDGPQPA